MNNDDREGNHNSKEPAYNEDSALDIIDIEFKDLEDWLKKEIKKVKLFSKNIVECLKLNKNVKEPNLAESEYEY